eukprot:CAMPEP_0202758656 /NCGR_PEP_ID=MMETSP1388-20130828/17199_1 /ASSEMBLY_ACC=CAM_ASM_000864 /TAXON_ID=37098 /ORGANISM="Isochrysis sp, Strain CCMP1244" /LENGTH=166 /DNA_ID=CAMNT_0049426617 /DNA_START=43 /DNA_END=543 /DNA_ORIENTATION=-
MQQAATPLLLARASHHLVRRTDYGHQQAPRNTLEPLSAPPECEPQADGDQGEAYSQPRAEALIGGDAMVQLFDLLVLVWKLLLEPVLEPQPLQLVVTPALDLAPILFPALSELVRRKRSVNTASARFSAHPLLPSRPLTVPVSRSVAAAPAEHRCASNPRAASTTG